MIWLVLVIPWLIMGWHATHMMKSHWLKSGFGWDRRDELRGWLIMCCGTLGWVNWFGARLIMGKAEYLHPYSLPVEHLGIFGYRDWDVGPVWPNLTHEHIGGGKA